MAQESIHNEIKWLEEKLEAKRQELGSSVEGKAEKELVRDIVKEAATQPASPLSLPPTAPVTNTNNNAASDEEEKEHLVIIEDLIKDALTNGLAHALKKAESLRNPHILDDFHDTLADKYYEKLLESRILKQ